MAHKDRDKGRKGDKGKGKKRDRARNEGSISPPVAGDVKPKDEAATTIQAAPELAPKVTRPRPVAARRVSPPIREAPRKVERPALPSDRSSLLALHQTARRERDAAPLLSRERAEASFEIERIEVQIARVERAMDPPPV